MSSAASHVTLLSERFIVSTCRSEDRRHRCRGQPSHARSGRNLRFTSPAARCSVSKRRRARSLPNARRRFPWFSAAASLILVLASVAGLSALQERKDLSSAEDGQRRGRSTAL